MTVITGPYTTHTLNSEFGLLLLVARTHHKYDDLFCPSVIVKPCCLNHRVAHFRAPILSHTQFLVDVHFVRRLSVMRRWSLSIPYEIVYNRIANKDRERELANTVTIYVHD